MKLKLFPERKNYWIDFWWIVIRLNQKFLNGKRGLNSIRFPSMLTRALGQVTRELCM